MDLSRQLRYFVVVAEELHFGRAAELLGIAQPPLSQSIQRLERELGVMLFDRSRRQICLTPAGQVLLAEARALLAGEQRMRTLMRMVRDGRLGTLRAGMPPETAAVTLRELWDRIGAQAPGLELDLQELTSAEQLRMLADAQLDVGIVHHPLDATDLRLGPVVEQRLGVVLPRTSPLARLPEVALGELAGNDLILFPRVTMPAWHDELVDICRQHGFPPRRLRQARNPEFLLGLVLAGRGVAFTPELVAIREPRAAWRPLSGDPLWQRLSGAWPARSAHPAAAQFAELAAEVLAGTARPRPVLSTADDRRPWTVFYDPWGTPGAVETAVR